jgi:hypothetical protein
MSEKAEVVQGLQDLGLPVLDVVHMRRNGSWYVVLDEGRVWHFNYADTLCREWAADLGRFLARYRMSQRKDELWRHFDAVPIQFRMAMVEMTMELAGEPISVPYPA